MGFYASNARRANFSQKNPAAYNMDTSIVFFAWAGTINLFYLFYQDVKNNMLVDDRKNWVMLGMALMLLSQIHRPIWYILIVFFGSGLLYGYMKYVLKGMGEADKNSILWVFIGFAIINPLLITFYVFLVTVISVIYHLLKNQMKIKKPIPFYPVLFWSFVIVCFTFKLYY